MAQITQFKRKNKSVEYSPAFNEIPGQYIATPKATINCSCSNNVPRAVCWCIIDQHLKWILSITVTNKIRKTIRKLKVLKPILPIKTLKTMHKVIVGSIYSYEIFVWWATYGNHLDFGCHTKKKHKNYNGKGSKISNRTTPLRKQPV